VLEVELRPAVAVANDLGPLESEWEDLAVRAQAGPFLRPGWIRAWWRAFGAGELELLTARRRERLVGLIVVARRRGVLQGTSNWHSPKYGILAETPVDRDALCATLFERAPRRVTLGFLDSSADLECLDTHARRAGYRVLVRTLEESPVIALGSGQEKYETRLGTNLRRNLRRSRRRLAAEGRVDVEVEDGRRALAEQLEECLRIEALSWKGTTGTAIVSRLDTRCFYDEVAHWAATKGLLRLAFLRLNGRAIAFQLALEDGVAYYPLKGSFDQDYARFSPGILLLHATVSRAFGERLERYELLGGPEKYKLDWATHRRDMRLLQAFAPGFAGRLERAAFAHGRPLAKTLRVDRALGRVGR
jgi:CelD/BcsL family acetyltransferase involved in cellulose biosynthesis